MLKKVFLLFYLIIFLCSASAFLSANDDTILPEYDAKITDFSSKDSYFRVDYYDGYIDENSLNLIRGEKEDIQEQGYELNRIIRRRYNSIFHEDISMHNTAEYCL